MPKSKLEKNVKHKLMIYLDGITILENKRPDWLISSEGERLELDFYLPDLDIAIEVQGRQHYTFIPYFHKTHKDFESQLKRDRAKKSICISKGITLLEVSSASDIKSVIDRILSLLPEKEDENSFIDNLKKQNSSKETMLYHSKKNLTKQDEKRFFRLVSKLNQASSKIAEYRISIEKCLPHEKNRIKNINGRISHQEKIIARVKKKLRNFI